MIKIYHQSVRHSAPDASGTLKPGISAMELFSWLNQRDGLSDDPLRRAAQIALSAINEIDFGELTDDTGLTVAYEALIAVLSE